MVAASNSRLAAEMEDAAGNPLQQPLSHSPPADAPGHQHQARIGGGQQGVGSWVRSHQLCNSLPQSSAAQGATKGRLECVIKQPVALKRAAMAGSELASEPN